MAYQMLHLLYLITYFLHLNLILIYERFLLLILNENNFKKYFILAILNYYVAMLKYWQKQRIFFIIRQKQIEFFNKYIKIYYKYR